MYFRLIGVSAALALGIFFMSLQGHEQKLRIITSDASYDLTIEVVETPEDKRIGLMGRESLPENGGMLFFYDQDSHPVMWMKDMIISLDILFIGSDFQINHIEKNVPPCLLTEDDQCPRYVYPYASTMVLELPANYTSEHGIEVGDRLELY